MKTPVLLSLILIAVSCNKQTETYVPPSNSSSLTAAHTVMTFYQYGLAAPTYPVSSATELVHPFKDSLGRNCDSIRVSASFGYKKIEIDFVTQSCAVGTQYSGSFILENAGLTGATANGICNITITQYNNAAISVSYKGSYVLPEYYSSGIIAGQIGSIHAHD